MTETKNHWFKWRVERMELGLKPWRVLAPTDPATDFVAESYFYTFRDAMKYAVKEANKAWAIAKFEDWLDAVQDPWMPPGGAAHRL